MDQEEPGPPPPPQQQQQQQPAAAPQAAAQPDQPGELQGLGPEQLAAVQLVEAGVNVLITGGAGVGKSHVVRVLLERLRARGKRVGLCPAAAAAAAAAASLAAASPHRSLAAAAGILPPIPRGSAGAGAAHDGAMPVACHSCRSGAGEKRAGGSAWAWP